MRTESAGTIAGVVCFLIMLAGAVGWGIQVFGRDDDR